MRTSEFVTNVLLLLSQLRSGRNRSVKVFLFFSAEEKAGIENTCVCTVNSGFQFLWNVRQRSVTSKSIMELITNNYVQGAI